MTTMLFPAEMIPETVPPNWPFEGLRPCTFSVIMADPPWALTLRSPKGITAKGAAGQYQVMTLDAIKALPVGDLAARDAVLWLWATGPMLRQALDVMDAWGFQYSTCGSWAKRTASGKLRWGTGYRLRSTSEPFLIGTRGRPKASRNVPSHIDDLAREHSRKPEKAYQLAELMAPSPIVNRIELFSREARPGWIGWGNEATKFNAEAA